MRRLIALILLAFVPFAFAQSSALAQNYTAPERGSPLRAALMDAIRIHAEWSLGAPVEFVIRDVRATDDVAFADVAARRPGGGEIDLAAAPMVARGEADAGDLRAPNVQALLIRSGPVWIVAYHRIDARADWWDDPAFCVTWGELFPERRTCR